MASDLTFAESIGVALITASATGTLAYLTARSNFKRDIAKIRVQIQEVAAQAERERVAELRQRYLKPLRFYAYTLSCRFSELELKFRSSEARTVRDWFKQVKDHVTRDKRREDFALCSCYEGIFALTTLYYTCSYFQCAREVEYSMPFRPFRESGPLYSEPLNNCLVDVRQSFYWNNESHDDSETHGIWDALQEVVGERFTSGDRKVSYEGMCSDLDSDDPFRRAPYVRPLDFFWWDLKPERIGRIQAALDSLVALLDSNDPGARSAA